MTPEGISPFVDGQMLVFTTDFRLLLDVGGITIPGNYTAFVDGLPEAASDSLSFTVTLRDVVRNGTSNVLTPTGSTGTTTNVTLQAYHAQFNEEFILDPVGLIDTVDDMTATQKEELRDAARVDFRNRVVISRIVNTDNTEIPDIASFPSSTDSVIVMIHASGLSGVTEFVIDFDGFLHRTVSDTDVDTDGNNYVDTINTGDDVTIAVTVPLGTSPSSYTATTEVQVEFIGTTTDFDFEEAALGDLLGAGVTVEDADLVVTPGRIESAIHLLRSNNDDDDDSTALADVQASLGIGDGTFVDLTDTPSSLGNDGQVLGITSGSLTFVDQTGGDQVIIGGETYTFTTGTTADGDPTLILTRNTGDVTYGTWIERTADDDTKTVDFMISGQFIAGGG